MFVVEYFIWGVVRSEGQLAAMQGSENRWFEGLTLVIFLALILAAVYSFSTIPSNPSASIAATFTPESLPTRARHTPTSNPTTRPTLHAPATAAPADKPTATTHPSRTPAPSPTTEEATPTWTHTPTPLPTAIPSAVPTETTLPDGTPTTTPVVITRTNSSTETMTLLPPDPLPPLEQPQQVVNILLLGSDQRGLERVGRTDTIVLATIHPEPPAVSLLSIPRDFFAWMPGHGFGKINTAFSRGGPELMKATIRHNFGVDVDYFARIGFDSFARIVDTLGGVDVAVECSLHDTFPDPASPSGETDLDWEPGIHHLDGKQALWYARSRWSTSDFDRHRRQQQVLRGLYRQALRLGVIPKIPSMWGTLRDSVSTDLDLQGLVRLGAIGLRLNTLNVKSRFVGRSVVEPCTGPEGLYVLIPDREALNNLVAEALAPPSSSQSGQAAWRISVVNRTRREDWGQVAAERLRWEGFQVTGVQAQGDPQPRTQILDFTTASDPASSAALYRLMRLYGRETGDVISSPSEQRDVDFQVLLGADYDPCAAVRSR